MTANAPIVFLSARYARRHELRRYREDLLRLGFRVASRWLDGEDEVGLEGPGREEARRWLEIDLVDMALASVVVCFSEAPDHQPPGGSRGGRHVELGMALEAGKEVLLVGPRENLFHWWLADSQVFETWSAALDRLDFSRAWGLPICSPLRYAGQIAALRQPGVAGGVE